MKITLPGIRWRDGRPRYEPSPTRRAQGFKGQDLRHPDGSWFSAGECLDWLNSDLAPKIVPPSGAGKRGRERPSPADPPGRAHYPLAQLFADLWQKPEFLAQQVEDGRRRRKPLKPKTIKWYKSIAELVARSDPELWASDCAAISPRMWERFLEKIEARHGLDTARAARATLSMAFGRIKPERLMGRNPFEGIRLPMPEPRLRAGEIAEMEHLIRTADQIGRPEIGDAIVLGLMSGQRQGDRLAMVGGQLVDGEILVKQLKTGAVVLMPATPQLIRRLDAMRERRRALTVQWPHLVIDEKINRPFAEGGDHYRHVFASVRDKAAETMPSLTDFRDQDLRDTACTWLANAGSTVPQICSITGHSELSIHTILKHYLARHPDQARAAIGNLIAWLERKGARL